MKKTLTIAAIALLLTSCGTTRDIIASYDIVLSEVVAPENHGEAFGETAISTLEEDGVSKYRYEDDCIGITWNVGSKMLYFTISNKSSHSIKINWDDISFVDMSGVARRVIHSGIKYVDKDKEQASTTIPRNASITDLLLPSHNIVYYDYIGWVVNYLFPCKYQTTDLMIQNAPSYVGKEMAVLLPIEIGGVRNEYTFTFKLSRFIH